MGSKSLFLLLPFYFLLLTFLGCATAPSVTGPAVTGLPGVYHRVQRGETLWRISRSYGASLDEIVRVNRIPDSARIEIGQLVFIPQKESRPTYQPGLASQDFLWPVKGKVISSFGQIFNNMVNKGLNIQTYKAEDVVASRGGKIVFYSDNLKGFGKTVIIDHQDGFSTVYANISQVFIKAKDTVEKGSVIGRTGATEGLQNDMYLHFEIRKGHIPQNPYFYLYAK
jgi:murein DD-endopeptidase MepM/ murein hydrolase activator NlpD